MEKIVSIERPKTVKQLMSEELLRMVVGGEFLIDLDEKNRWAWCITVYMHPVTDRKFSVITAKGVAPKGKAIIRRTA